MGTFRVERGKAEHLLPEMEPGAVRCIVTSPPYWGLRDYDHDDQLGAERHPDLYIARLVAILRETRRVLADDGTMWLNLGDCYITVPYAADGLNAEDNKRSHANTRGQPVAHRQANRQKHIEGFKHKDLVGIPWRVAIALQADGWYLRSDVIWQKPNAMPSSVTDRPTASHEYVFLLTKSMRYYYDIDAIREPHNHRPQRRPNGLKPYQPPGSAHTNTWTTSQRDEPDYDGHPLGRNKRTVWSVNTESYQAPPGLELPQHFAVMPRALAEPCILAGSAMGDTVLDPFAGSGTVGVVALQHGRSFVGCELNDDYAKLARYRLAKETDQGQLFTPGGVPLR